MGLKLKIDYIGGVKVYGVLLRIKLFWFDEIYHPY